MQALQYLKTRRRLACALWIAVCFTLTSSVYLSWNYRLIDLTEGRASEWLSMVAGYLFQAAGMALTALYLRREPAGNHRRVFTLTTAAFVMVSLPALVSDYMLAAVIFGSLMNLLCGVMAGYYLFSLSASSAFSGGAHTGLSFGGGYSLSTLAVFLLSLIGGGSFLRSRAVLPVYLLLCAAAAGMMYLFPLLELPGGGSSGEDFVSSRETLRVTDQTLVLAFAMMILLSLVKNLGFGWPSSDIKAGLRPELSRVFYGLSLAAAGYIYDKNRRNGALCTLAALSIPFIMLSVANEPVSGTVMWCLDYLFYGFFSVFRAALFTDMASETRRWYLAPAGLLAGRMGDAGGTAVCLALSGNGTALIFLTAALFVATVFLFARLSRQLFEPAALQQRSEREAFETFAARYDLSPREREVLRLIIEEKSNSEIAETLYVTESTIKYHVHNLLKKTGCRSRVEMIGRYAEIMFPGRETSP